MFRPTQKEFEFNTALIILYALSKGPAHGYEIMRRIEEEFFIHKSPGILYPSLRKLVSMGYIEVSGQGMKGRKIMRIYKITESGVKFLESHMQRIEFIKRFFKGMRIFESVGGSRVREAIFKLVEVLPSAGEDDLNLLRSYIDVFVKSLEDLRNRILSRGE
ncbi:PadR family transcriptional regulator [Ignisphaera sp. 4213-co]|uniref:PadR family transcriptional regulator n=1 Tax=Ignisphaera cupida TaxID=3050454 RepID=A0ABD4Z7I7_9CREN|nr:PadR family transcriptional regulator [Ignisphaera sp. 4213-co]MDK6028669.1 PadR family transcriptional regulator [Ignisphaera sp. 4213-co]